MNTLQSKVILKSYNNFDQCKGGRDAKILTRFTAVGRIHSPTLTKQNRTKILHHNAGEIYSGISGLCVFRT